MAVEARKTYRSGLLAIHAGKTCIVPLQVSQSHISIRGTERPANSQQAIAHTTLAAMSHQCTQHSEQHCLEHGHRHLAVGTSHTTVGARAVTGAQGHQHRHLKSRRSSVLPIGPNVELSSFTVGHIPRRAAHHPATRTRKTNVSCSYRAGDNRPSPERWRLPTMVASRHRACLHAGGPVPGTRRTCVLHVFGMASASTLPKGGACRLK